MFKIPKEHSIMLLVAADKSTEQAIELAVLSIMVPSRQVPQLDTMLYFRDEQLESTVVQLKTSCLGLMSTNWMFEGGGGGSKNEIHSNKLNN